jgi:hypothetical protein
VGFVVDKVALGQVFSEYFGFLAHLHSTEFSINIITRGRYSRPNTQLDSTPRYANHMSLTSKRELSLN